MTTRRSRSPCAPVRLTPGFPFLLMELINLVACFLVMVYYRRQAAENAARVTQAVY